MSRASAARSVGGSPAPVGRLRAAVATHQGLVRTRNEDRAHADTERGVFIVVDGMGGEAAGDQAAETALACIRQRLERRSGTAEERVREGIAVANNEILARAASNPDLAGMGCVATVAVVEDRHVTIGHVGDSRLYRVGPEGIEKVTRDHSPVGEREDSGDLDELEAMRHARRHEVYRSVGTQPRTPSEPGFIDVSEVTMDDEDALLLCSDGLTDLVTSEEILELCRAHARDLENLAESLVAAALARGGKDNVTVVLAAGPRFGAPAARPAGLAPPRPHAEDSRRSWTARPAAWIAAGLIAGALLAAAGSRLVSAPPVPAAAIDPGARSQPQTLRVGRGQRFVAIGDALAAARAGDTVLVLPGVYREQVRLKEGVTLASLVPRGATLAPTSEGGAVVAVVGEGLGSGRIGGFVIRGASQAPPDVGIRLRDAAVTVEDVEIRDARLAGVLVEGGVPARILASWIHDNPGAGVIVRRGASARLAGNRIEDNGRAGAGAAGIELERGARVALLDNVIVGNTVAGVRGASARDQRAFRSRNLFEVPGRLDRPAFAPARAGNGR